MSVFIVLTFASAKVQQFSDIRKHLHKNLSFLPIFFSISICQRSFASVLSREAGLWFIFVVIILFSSSISPASYAGYIFCFGTIGTFDYIEKDYNKNRHETFVTCQTEFINVGILHLKSNFGQ